MRVSSCELRPFRGRPSALFAAAAIGAIVAGIGTPPTWAQPAGDIKEKDKKKIVEEGRRLFGDKDKKPEAAADRGGWAILIAIFRGQGHEELAKEALAEFRTRGQLPEAYAQKRGEATCILVGNFEGPEDPAAHDELKRIQTMELGGAPQYAGSYLAPPPQASLKGSIPEYNLTRAKLLHGKKAIQTLQVGVYGREDLQRVKESDLKECRKAAEEAVVKLRQEGELAWYYHGQRRSMVCVGVFDLSDFDPQIPGYKSARLKETQKRFPHNLYNGQAIRVRVKGQRAASLQPSQLVAIPEK